MAVAIVNSFSIASWMMSLRIATRHNLDALLRLPKKCNNVGVVMLTELVSWFYIIDFTTLTVRLSSLTSRNVMFPCFTHLRRETTRHESSVSLPRFTKAVPVRDGCSSREHRAFVIAKVSK